MGPYGMHQNVGRCLCEAALNYIRKVTVIEGAVPEHWKRTNVTPLFKKGKRNLRNYRQASLTLIPGKVMEKLILKTVFRHLKDR